MNSINPEKIWILEDEAGCRFVYEQILGIRYLVRFFERLTDFNMALEAGGEFPDLIIADLCLADGFFLNINKQEGFNLKMPAIPFIIVSSLDDLDVLRHCFQSGAYDYLTKPFQKSELIVKIERIFKKSSAKTAPRTLPLGQDLIFSELTLKEQKIFNLFMGAREHQLCKSEILTKVWGDTKIDPKTIDVHLYNLRKKLETHGIEIKLIGAGAWVMSNNRMDHPRAN